MNSLIIYYFIFIIDYIICIFASKTKNKLLLLLSFLLPVIFVGFRYNVGTDFQSYVYMFENFKTLSFHQMLTNEWELASKIIIFILSKFFNNPSSLFLMIAILNYLPIVIINKHFNYKYLPMSLFIYNCVFLPFCMNGMRQGIAMCFIFYSVMLLLFNDQKKSIVFLIISFLFHKSCILFLPYYYIIFTEKENDNKNIGKKIILLTIVMSILILFFLKNILLNFGILKYSSYYNNINAENISFSTLLTYMPIIIILLLSKYKDKVINTLKPIVISGYLYHVIGTTARYLYRISLYFTLFEVILIPYLIYNCKDKNTKIIISLLFIIYLLIYFWYQFYIVGQHEIFPYIFKF